MQKSEENEVYQQHRDLFDSQSFQCLSYLESCDDFDSIEFHVNEGIKPNHVQLWQSRNTPYILPNDLNELYMLFNGFSISWRVNIAVDKPIVIGNFSLNKLEDLKRIPVEGSFMPCEWLDHNISIDDPKNYAAFVIDSNCDIGDIVMLYSRDDDHNDEDHDVDAGLLRRGCSYPSIWLVDLSQQWHFICSRFGNYLNLMYAHLGIIGWQEAYTAEGLSPTTRTWMNIFCKERLCIDQHSHVSCK